MRSKVPLGMRTYQLASSLWTNPVDVCTLGGGADTIKKRCFSCVFSPDNEDSEHDIWDSGETLLCGHITKVLREVRLAKKLDTLDTREVGGHCGVRPRRMVHPENVRYKYQLPVTGKVLGSFRSRLRHCCDT